MKLKFESIAELREFVDFAMTLGARTRSECRGEVQSTVHRVMAPGLLQKLSQPEAPATPPGEPADPLAAAIEAEHQDAGQADDAPQNEQPETDANGVRYDERIHAPSRSLNGDGTWRAKRKVSPELVAQVLAEQQAETPSADEPGGEELVTETHALPVDDAGSEPEADTEAPAETAAGPQDTSIDFTKLLADAEVLAADLSGDMVKVLAVCQAFLAATSHKAFAALKLQVAPDGNGAGKALPAMTPAERRLLEAAMTLYLAPDAPAE